VRRNGFSSASENWIYARRLKNAPDRASRLDPRAAPRKNTRAPTRSSRVIGSRPARCVAAYGFIRCACLHLKHGGSVAAQQKLRLFRARGYSQPHSQRASTRAREAGANNGSAPIPWTWKNWPTRHRLRTARGPPCRQRCRSSRLDTRVTRFMTTALKANMTSNDAIEPTRRSVRLSDGTSRKSLRQSRRSPKLRRRLVPGILQRAGFSDAHP